MCKRFSLRELLLCDPMLRPQCTLTVHTLCLWQTMLAELGYRLSLPTVWCFMKRFCKAGGRQVATPDAFFHTISYFIELAMIQVCCPCANVRGIFKEKNALFGTDDVRPCDLCMCNNTGADVEIPALADRGFVH